MPRSQPARLQPSLHDVLSRHFIEDLSPRPKHIFFVPKGNFKQISNITAKEENGFYKFYASGALWIEDKGFVSGQLLGPDDNRALFTVHWLT
ncbi:hypothetical protein PT974_01877 [Cladobotryum mycophilum]|uniref:Uncharacterized protein n=1 Tax=Cladobotryum mycophilum TaxID=491253 RepID=A0ABR0SXB8_9HYPO